MPIESVCRFIDRFDDMFNTPDIHIADEIFEHHFISHVPMMPVLDLISFKAFLQSFYDAFPDFRIEIDDRIVTTDRIVLRVRYYGTHKGDFLGIPATGLEIEAQGISIFRIESDCVVESWIELDVFSIIQQISVMPSHTCKHLYEIPFLQIAASNN